MSIFDTKYVYANLFLLVISIPACSASGDPDDDEEDLPDLREPVLAQYKGGSMPLSEGWGSAQICAELGAGDVRCYDTEAEYRADVGEDTNLRSRSECAPTWICIWDHINYTGRRLQFRDRGTKHLGDWGFRDRVSSFAHHKGTSLQAKLIDQRTGLPDGYLYIENNNGYPDLRSWGFNDKADKLQVP